MMTTPIAWKILQGVVWSTTCKTAPQCSETDEGPCAGCSPKIEAMAVVHEALDTPMGVIRNALRLQLRTYYKTIEEPKERRKNV